MPVGRARREPVAARTACQVRWALRRQFVERADGWCCSVDDEEWSDVEPWTAMWRAVAYVRSCGQVYDSESVPRVCGATVVRCIEKLWTVRQIGRSWISHNGTVAATSMANRGEYVRRGRQL
jgi:hypothetical protein